MRLRLALLGAATLCAACQDKPRPWDGPADSGARRTNGEPFLPKTASASPSSLVAPASPKSKEGGLWSSCYRGFRTSRNATTDTVRLGMLCGPITGMRKIGETHAGTLSEDEPTKRVPFAVERGGCYRVFAAAARQSSSPLDLDLSILSSRSSRLAQDTTESVWAALPADKALCTFAKDSFEVQIEVQDEALDDKPTWAVEIWQLPPTH